MSGYSAQVQAAVPYVKATLSAQKQMILSYMLGGLSMGHALKAAGAVGLSVLILEEDVDFMQYVQYFAERHVESIQFTIDDAHAMLIDTHRKSLNATEELNTIKEMIALHGLAAPKKQVNINEHHHFRESDMRILSDAELNDLAGQGSVVINIEPEEIEYETDE